MNQIRIALMTVTTVTAAAIAYAAFAPSSSKPVQSSVLASAVKPEARVFAQADANSKPKSILNTALNTALYKLKTPMVVTAQSAAVAQVALQRVGTDAGNHERREGDDGERD